MTSAWADGFAQASATGAAAAWAGDEVIFISDRNDGAANLYAYDTRGKQLRQLSKQTLWDVRNVAVYGRSAVYEAGGRGGYVDLDLHQIVAGSRVAGPARTVRCGQDDNLMAHAVMAEVQPGEVIVLSMPE